MNKLTGARTKERYPVQNLLQKTVVWLTPFLLLILAPLSATQAQPAQASSATAAPTTTSSRSRAQLPLHPRDDVDKIRAMRRAQHRQMREQRMKDEGLNTHMDITYVPGSKNSNQELDLYLPDQAPKPYPVIVFIHGGGWHSGGRKARIFLPLVKRGYAVASISYRLTTEAIWPAQIYDCKAAIRWLRAHAKEYSLDPERIGVWGDSAGAHLAAMLGTSDGIKPLEGDGGNLKYSSSVQAVCDWFGPTDLITMLEQQQQLPVLPGSISPSSKNFVEWLLGGPVSQHLKAAKEASPVTYVTNKVPPFFIAHGDKDTTVPIAQSKELLDALNKVHADAAFRIIPNAGHGTAAFPPTMRHEAFVFFDEKLHNKYAATHNAN